MIRTNRAHLQVAAISHPGMTGKNNEDRFAVSSFELSQENPTASLLAVLSDGIGGHRAGEIAAEIAVDTISRVVAESDGLQPLEILQKAIYEASQRIYAQAQGNGDQNGMGSTCACVWVIGDRLYTVSVGDSRVYLQRGDNIYQLTIDHTWVQELVERGQITPEQIRGHPHAHVIRRYLGSAVPPEGDFRLRLGANENNSLALGNQGLTLRPGDRLLLCSDGLTDLVSETEICQALDGKKPTEAFTAQKPAAKANSSEIAPEEQLNGTLQDLVGLANQRGGHDNITIILLQVPEKARDAIQAAGLSSKWRTVLVGFMGLAVFGFLAATAFFGLTLFGGNRPIATEANSSATLANGSQMPTELMLSETPLFITSATYSVSAGFSLTMTSQAGNAAGPTLTPWPTNTYPAGQSPVSITSH